MFKFFASLIIVYSLSGHFLAPKVTINSLNTATIERFQDNDNKTITPTRAIVESMRSGAFNKNNTPLFATIKDKNDKTKIIETIKIIPGVTIDENDEWVTLVSRGGKNLIRRRMNGLLVSYGGLRTQTIATKKIITFNFFDALHNAAYGQKHDIESIQCLYHEIQRQQPKINCILFGDSLGAIRALNFLSQEKDTTNVKGVILLVPPLSMWHASRTLTRKYFKLPEKLHLLNYGFFITTFLLHSPFIEYNLRQQTSKITNQHIVIHHLVDTDVVVDNDTILELIELLSKNGTNTIYLNLIIDKDLIHENVIEHESVKLVNHAFYKHRSAPHNAEYAQQGQQLIEHARQAGKDPVKAFLAVTDQINNKYKQ